MISDALQAWVIHKYWCGDTSANVVFFTREQGLVTCLYKGGRSAKKQALLQAFSPLWLLIDVRGDRHFVRQLELVAPPLNLPGTILFAGLYVNELLHHALRPRDAHEHLYAAYIHTLETLMKAGDRFAIEAVLRRFEWVLLTTCGYQISLTHEARTFMPIEACLYYQLLPGEGFVLAHTGFTGAHLIKIASDKLDDREVLKTAKSIMRQAIDHALDGREIKARALYHQSTIK